MMGNLSKIFLWLSFALMPAIAKSQPDCYSIITDKYYCKTEEYLNSIKHYDLSELWCTDSLQAGEWGDYARYAFPESIGFIGEDYERFYIHFINVKRSTTDPYKYHVYGKTRIRNNIKKFNGTINVKKADISKIMQEYGFGIRWGNVSCSILFYQDSSRAGSGEISGTLKTDFYINYFGLLRFSDLDWGSDSECNNQCSATWTDYKSKKKKKCNWGIYRIPESELLDKGVGQFSVESKYIKNGWQTYYDAFPHSYEDKYSEKLKNAQKIEEAKWWE
jgi:hypothetical protein